MTASGVAVAMLAAFVLVAGTLAWASRSDQPGTVVASPSDGGVSVLEIPDPAAAADAQDAPEPVTTTEPAEEFEPAESGEPAEEPTATTTATVVPPVVAPEDLMSVTLIGDSVLKGAEGAILLKLGENANVDATVNRQFKHADDVVSELRDRGELGEVVVIHLGTNGAFSGGTWDEVMNELSDVDRVIVLTAFVPRRWQSTVNAAIASGIERWPQVETIDYNSFGNAHPEYYNADGVHLNGTGQAAYAELIYEALAE